MNWTPQCESAFLELKAYLESLELLSILDPGDTLYLYLGVFESAVSSALIYEVEKVQKPVYYISKTLLGQRQGILTSRN